VLGVAEPDGDGDAEDHEQPVDLRDVDLAVDLLGRVHDLHSREAAERLALVDNGERPADDRLASDHRSQDRQHQYRPPYDLCIFQTMFYCQFLFTD
jgi:hypothetical protein